MFDDMGRLGFFDGLVADLLCCGAGGSGLPHACIGRIVIEGNIGITGGTFEVVAQVIHHRVVETESRTGKCISEIGPLNHYIEVCGGIGYGFDHIGAGGLGGGAVPAIAPDLGSFLPVKEYDKCGTCIALARPMGDFVKIEGGGAAHRGYEADCGKKK